MILKARAGETYTGQVLINQAFVMEMPAFTLKSGWAWLHWLLEMGIVVTATTWSSYSASRRPFSESTQEWYGQETMVGGVKESEEQFLTWLQADDFRRAGELIVSEEELSHPTLEVYAQQSGGAPTDSGSVLLTLKRTFLDPKGQVKRKPVLQGEMLQNQYRDLIFDLQQKLQPEKLGADA